MFFWNEFLLVNVARESVELLTTFEEVLLRQQAESEKIGVTEPIDGEADYLFEIKSSDEVQSVIQEIVNTTQAL